MNNINNVYKFAVFCHCCCVLDSQSNAELPAWAVLSSAALGAFAYWLTIFPVDVIKSSMQVDNIIPSQRKYPNMVQTAKVGRGWGRSGEWGFDAKPSSKHVESVKSSASRCKQSQSGSANEFCPNMC